MNTLLCIDSYLSDKEKVFTCYKLIKQLRYVFPEYKILLINKHSNSGGLESEVDYYFYNGNSVIIGEPPKRLTESTLYNKPYLFFENSGGILEYWLPYSGITDYVASIYNTFILSSKIANSLEFSHVFRIEYDTEFEINELQNIKSEIELEKDYLFYGERHEGLWKSYTQYLFDLQICGFNCNVFSDCELIKNDEDYWSLCEKIGYIGKWIEYLIPAIVEYKKKSQIFHGLTFQGFLIEKYPLSKFDTISNSSSWINRWRMMPRICRISLDEGVSELENKVLLFFWNAGNEYMEIETKTNTGYSKKLELPHDVWSYDIIDVNSEIKFHTQIKTEKEIYYYDFILNPNEIPKLDNRFLLK